MNCNALTAAALIALVGVSCAAQAADEALARAARRLSVERIQSLEYVAAGRYYQFTQAPGPDLPWPPFEVRDYVATLDYARAAVHARYFRVQIQEPGRARPHAEATMDQYARDGVSWNLTPQPTAMPVNVAERDAELWASPQGFVKAALASDASSGRDGRGGTKVRFTRDGKRHYEGVIDARGEVTVVRGILDSPVLGDTPFEFRYSHYRDFDGVRFPARIERRIADLPWYELDVSAVRVNVAQEFDVPPDIAADPVPSMAQVEVSEVAPGVLLFGGGSHNSVVIEQRRGLVVIEAPLAEQRSEAVLARVRALYPGTPISAVINTHVHFDHAGGLRTYVAEGVPVVTHAANVAYYERAWSRPRTLEPDRLARAPRPVRFQPVDGMLTLEDDVQPIEIHAIRGSGHNDAFLMVYLPRHRLLVEADAFTPPAPGARPPAKVNPLWINLDENIRRLALEVDRIVPLHGAVQSYATFQQAIAPR